MSEDFATLIGQQREYLTNMRARLLHERGAIEESLSYVDLEFEAIDAYEAAKTGKTATSNAAPKATRSRRGSKREGLMAIIAEGVGFTRGDLLDRMGVRGDKAGEMAVSNALTAMKKLNQIRNEHGRYFPAVAEQEPETWPTQEQQAALQEAAE